MANEVTELAGRCSYLAWRRGCWRGDITQLLEELRVWQQRLGAPPPEASDTDPRKILAKPLTCQTNNQSRMNYPQYRQQGLPLTSSHIESTIKQINARVKRTERFWEQTTGDAILRLRADTVGASRPLDAFWTRWQAQQTGVNCHHPAA